MFHPPNILGVKKEKKFKCWFECHRKMVTTTLTAGFNWYSYFTRLFENS